MKTPRFFLLLITVLGLFASQAFAANPSGQWTWSSTGPNGRTLEATLDLKVTDGKVSGSITNAMGTEAISDAKLAGDDLSFSVTRKVRRREITVHYTGKIAGDTITGAMTTTGRNDQEIKLAWNAQRVPAK